MTARDSPPFQRCAKIPKRHHQRHDFGRARIETECDIESSRLIGDSMNNDPPNPNSVSRLSDSPGRITKHRPSQTTPLPTAIHGQPRQYHHGDRTRHISPELPGNGCLCNSTGGEYIVTNDALAFTQYV